LPKPERAIVDLFGEVGEAPDMHAKPLADCNMQGRFAEFMVCAYLTKLGHNVIHVDANGFDLIVEYQGASYRVDVKSTMNVYIGKRKELVIWKVGKGYWAGGETQKRTRPVSPLDCDMLALFHSVFETVVFIPVVEQVQEIRLPLSQVRNSDLGAGSFVASIAAIQRGRGGLKSLPIPVL
jgi:hypothetical protein